MSTAGLTAENIKASGYRIRCMARVSTLGVTEGDTKDSTSLIRNMASASTHGQTAENMRVHGPTVCVMAVGST